MNALNITVRGRVQGVMFRDFVRRKARALGLLGEVENMADGTVQVRAEGEEVSLEKLAALLRRGPILARVDDVQLQFVEPTGAFKDFHIVYD